MNRLPSFYIGTTNPFKIREIASILRPLQIGLKVTEPIDPVETGQTFEANALIKAEAYSGHVKQSLIDAYLDGNADYVRADPEERKNIQRDYLRHLELSRIWTICEDSGIVIPALDGLPGPWSARFADCIVENGHVVRHNYGQFASREMIDQANNGLVLRLMRAVEQPHRAATFVVTFVVADINGQSLFKTTSEITGWILPEARGSHGFGYDPIFASGRSFGKSFGEIDGMRKNLISHRRQALQQFTTWLAGQIK